MYRRYSGNTYHYLISFDANAIIQSSMFLFRCSISLQQVNLINKIYFIFI